MTSPGVRSPAPAETLRRTGVSLAVALSVVLATGSSLAAQSGGVVVGTVTDGSSGNAVAAAQLVVAGTALVAQTDADGAFRFPRVPAGEVVLTVERLGYQPERRTIQVGGGETVSVEIVLAVSAVALDGIVATAAGPQRRREVGNASTVIQAGRELEAATPVGFTSLLQGRAPGVQVLESSGTVGASSTIKIRGNSSISLDNTPLIYIDGARVSNDIRAGPGVGGQNTGRLNDLNPNDIEAIEIVKGPSAATLYGTEAAAGVIRITTRRGTTGSPEWTYRTSVGGVWDATEWPESAINLQSPAFLGPFARDTVYTTNLLEGDGTDQDPWRTGVQQAWGASLRGGSDGITYFLSGEFSDREGTFVNNSAVGRTLRANLNIAPADNVDVAISTGFNSSKLFLPNNDNTTLGYIGVALNNFPWELPLVRDDPVTGDQDVETCALDYEFTIASGEPLGSGGCSGTAFFSNQTFEDVATITNTQKIERFTTSVATDYRPRTWLRAQGTIGYDQYSDQTGVLIPPDASLVFGSVSLGLRSLDTYVNRNLTIEGSLRATWDLSPSWRSVTSIGGQIYGQKSEASLTLGRTLPAGTGTVSNAVFTEAGEAVAETRTLGLYLEQQLAWDDRLFLTPAVRFDENSSFGENLGREAYPRMMVSYVVRETPGEHARWLGSLRLRGAWGESGKQPASFSALTLLDPQRLTFRRQDVAGVSISQPGNENLKPERGQELELGFEAELFTGRVAIDFTWFDQHTDDAIVQRRLAPSTGYPMPQFDNIGRIEHSGVELGLTAVAVNRPDMFWTWQVVGGLSEGEITTLDEPIIFGLNGDSQRHEQGYPYAAYFSTEYFIGEDGTVQSTDEPVYLGQPTPEWEGSVSTTLRLFNRVTLYANLGFAGGHQLYNSTEEFRCGFLGGGPNGGICPAIYERTEDGSPTDEARIKTAAAAGLSYGPWIEDADFARLRMVGVRLDLPAAWVARVGASRADFTLTGENLGLWTSYSGLDPEINFAGADQSSRADFLTLPPSRRVTGRISVTF